MANWANVDRLGNPADPAWQRDNLTQIEPVPGQKWQVYKPAADSFNGLLGDLVAAGYKPTSSGGFNYRTIRGSDKLSQHAFGTAIDLNAGANPMLGRGDAVVTDLPPNTADIAKKYGLEWGGTWKRPDAMHFEYVGGGQPPAASPAGIGDLVAQNQAPSVAPGSPVAPDTPPVATPSGSFGDLIASAGGPDFGSVIATYLANRQRRDESQQADEIRRQALFGQVGSPFA
jgi:hypothetical protein